ncbi:hypothetical protein CC80DRAFT_496080, partial [Byssothecium circinans]
MNRNSKLVTKADGWTKTPLESWVFFNLVAEGPTSMDALGLPIKFPPLYDGGLKHSQLTQSNTRRICACRQSFFPAEQTKDTVTRLRIWSPLFSRHCRCIMTTFSLVYVYRFVAFGHIFVLVKFSRSGHDSI